MTEIDDTTAAAAFRKLVAHLQHRTDAQNVDLMGLAGFCRNCLGDWLSEASNGALSSAEGREYVYGMPYAEWKARHQQPATPDQLQRMEESLKRNLPEPGQTMSRPVVRLGNMVDGCPSSAPRRPITS